MVKREIAMAVPVSNPLGSRSSKATTKKKRLKKERRTESTLGRRTYQRHPIPQSQFATIMALSSFFDAFPQTQLIDEDP